MKIYVYESVQPPAQLTTKIKIQDIVGFKLDEIKGFLLPIYYYERLSSKSRFSLRCSYEFNRGSLTILLNGISISQPTFSQAIEFLKLKKAKIYIFDSTKELLTWFVADEAN